MSVMMSMGRVRVERHCDWVFGLLWESIEFFHMLLAGTYFGLDGGVSCNGSEVEGAVKTLNERCAEAAKE